MNKMVLIRAIRHYRQDGLNHLLSIARRWLAYHFEYCLFGLERALLTDRQWFWYTVRRNQRGVDAAADPRELRYVDPTEIKRASPFETRFCFRKFGDVRGGDWDLDPEILAERFDYIWEAMRARYVDGRAWEDISLVQEVLAENETWRFACGEDVWQWVHTLDTVYESIQQDGYRSARDILDVSWEEAAEPTYDSLVERFRPVANESGFFYSTDEVTIFDYLADIQVDIGRDGEILQHNGRHRLWFAQHLGIETIPVVVIVRHNEWQELRDEIANATTKTELSDRARRHLDHPDMIDVAASLDTADNPSIQLNTANGHTRLNSRGQIQ